MPTVPLPSAKLSRRMFGAGVLAAGLATAAGCSSDDKDSGSSNSSGGSKGKTDKVTYLTGFGLPGREGFVHAAVEKGYFSEAGLEVDIQPGQAGDYNYNALASGQAQFAAVDYSGVPIRFAENKKAARIVASVQLTTLLSIITFEETGIKAPKDLEGKTLGAATGAAPYKLWPGYAQLAGVDAGKPDWKFFKPDQLIPLLVSGQLKGIGTFITSVANVEAADKAAAKNREPRKATALPYSDYLTDLYGTVLTASSDLIDKNPDLVRRFTSALLRGVQFMVDNPTEAGNIFHKNVPAVTAATATYEMQLMKPYVTNGNNTLGVIDTERIARSLALMEGLGLAKGVKQEEMVAFDVVPKA